MNATATQWAWRQHLPSTHKLVLLALAFVADVDGTCSPSITSLAALCSVSTRTVRRALRDLEADGLLKAEPRLRPDGSTTSNQYRLCVTAGHVVSPAPDTGVMGPGRMQAAWDDRPRHGELGQAGIISTGYAPRDAGPMASGREREVTSVPGDRNRGVPSIQAAETLVGAASPGPGLDGHTPPPVPAAGTATSPAVATGAPTTEKPFAYLRSVIGG